MEYAKLMKEYEGIMESGKDLNEEGWRKDQEWKSEVE